MGLFTRKKSIYEYKMMEQVKCDLDADMRNPNPGYSDYCRLIAESNDYLFYSYKSYQDNSGGYVIRKSKTNPRETLFFGENYQLACVFKNFLFQCGHSGERGRFYIFAKNILTGNVTKCDWLGKGDIYVNINGYGRFYVQDTINSVSVQGDTLIFDVTRKKSSRSENSDKYDVDTNYYLKVTIENGQFKPVAYFDIAPMEEKKIAKDTEEQNAVNDVLCIEKPSVPSALGRDENRHIHCQYEGHENDCPQDCEKCAISIKTEGDIALSQNDFDKAIKQYKKAVFVEPKFAEAWVNMGNAYGMKSEHNNAVSSFNKAIVIDPTYGKALFGKAIALKNQGKLDESMALANKILEMYDDTNVKSFKNSLVRSGVKDMSNIYTLEQAIDIMTNQAYDIIQANNMLDENGCVSTEKEIYFKEDFARSIYEYCKKQYGSLGSDKVWSESILASFYGSLCATLLYYTDKVGFKDTTPFAYLANHVNLEELDRNAERLLEIRQDEGKSDELWNVIYSFVTACKTIFEKIEQKDDVEAAVIDATESAYVMGMLYAMRFTEQKKNAIQSSAAPQNVLDQIDKLHEEIEQLSPMMKYGYGNQEIIDAAEGTGYTPQEYRENIHKTFYQKQRDYNHLIDQYSLQNIRQKYVIDSFSDYSSDLKLLDPVEVDLKKRIASSSFLSRCQLLTENSKYRFYLCDFSMLREDKRSGIIVYFGHSASPACIFRKNSMLIPNH